MLGSVGEEERQKSRSEEKVVGFSAASLFPRRKLETVTIVETDGELNHLMRRIMQGASIVKGWVDK